MVAAAYYNPDFNVINRILLSNNPQKQARRVLISIVVVDMPHNVIGSNRRAIDVTYVCYN